MSTDTGTGKKPPAPASPAISTEDAISMFDQMIPSQEVLMRREMEQMFLSIEGAMRRGVDAQQIIDGLKKKWPSSHSATIIRLLNAERDRRLQMGDHIDCKAFGSMRKPRKAKKISQGAEACNASNASRGADA